MIFTKLEIKSDTPKFLRKGFRQALRKLNLGEPAMTTGCRQLSLIARHICRVWVAVPLQLQSTDL